MVIEVGVSAFLGVLAMNIVWKVLERKLFETEWPLTKSQWEALASCIARDSVLTKEEGDYLKKTSRAVVELSLTQKERQILNSLEVLSKADDEGRSIVLTRLSAIEISLEEIARLVRQEREEARVKIEQLYERHIEHSSKMASSMTQVTEVLRQATEVLREE